MPRLTQCKSVCICSIHVCLKLINIEKSKKKTISSIWSVLMTISKGKQCLWNVHNIVCYFYTCNYSFDFGASQGKTSKEYYISSNEVYSTHYFTNFAETITVRTSDLLLKISHQQTALRTHLHKFGHVWLQKLVT